MKKLLHYIILTTIILGCGNTNKNKEVESLIEPPKKELTIQEILSGNYLQKPSSGVEVFTVLTTDNKYYQKTFIDGDEYSPDNGDWKIIELSTKTLTDKRSASFILFDNKFILQIFDKCFGLPKAPFGDIAWDKGYMTPESEFLSTMDLSAPFNIHKYYSECIKPTLKNKDIFKNLFKELYTTQIEQAGTNTALQSEITNKDFYIIATGIASNENEASEKVNKLNSAGYASDYLWIPDYKSLSGAKYYSVYIGPFSTIDECAFAVEEYRKSNPSAYGLLVSNQSSKRVEIRGPNRISTK